MSFDILRQPLFMFSVRSGKLYHNDTVDHLDETAVRITRHGFNIVPLFKGFCIGSFFGFPAKVQSTEWLKTVIDIVIISIQVKSRVYIRNLS